jgi:hypothetical protein
VADDPYPALTQEVPSKGGAEEMALADAKQAVRGLSEDWRDSARTEWPLTGEYVDTWINRRLPTMADWPECLKTFYMDAVKAHLDAEGVKWRVQGHQMNLVVRQ